MNTFAEKLTLTKTLVDSRLHHMIKTLDGHQTPLIEAIYYSALNGGKRIRPLLCLAFGDALSVNQEHSLRVACAIELLHSYSLIHDDLPSMDNSNIRRGKPSCHVHFDEATAILAGDAMLAFAFEILSSSETHPDAHVRCQLVSLMAKAGGPQGMALGQMMDIEGTANISSLEELKTLQKLKTSLLIEFSCLTPAILKQSSSEIYHAIHSYSEKIGLLYQVVDDILDCEGTQKTLGKPTGQDVKKVTYITFLGVKQAKAYAEELYHGALQDLKLISPSSQVLEETTQFIFKRSI